MATIGAWSTPAAVATDAVIGSAGWSSATATSSAVDGIDFDVAPGEVFGLLGPNGAGKTTTVEILEGLRAPDGGQATVLGVDVAKGADALKPRIGVSLQTAALYPKLTVTEVIDLFRSFYPTLAPDRRADRRARARRATRTPRPRSCRAASGSGWRSPSRSSTTPSSSSSTSPRPGWTRPPDDRSGTSSVGLKAEGRTVLLTTHYMEEAEILCDRLAIMDHGRILEMGTVDELVSKRFQERAVRFDATDGLDRRRARRPCRRSSR